MATPANSIGVTTAGAVTFNGTTFSGGTLTVPNGGTGLATATTAYGVVCGGTTATGNFQVLSSLGTSGQALVSNGPGALPSFQTITVAGVTWNDEATNFTAADSNGYFVTAAATATLPASPSQGDVVYFVFDGTTGAVTITANTGQTIRLGAVVSAAAGTAVNTARGDSITVVYRTSDTSWIATSVIGTWNIT